MSTDTFIDTRADTGANTPTKASTRNACARVAPESPLASPTWSQGASANACASLPLALQRPGDRLRPRPRPRPRIVAANTQPAETVHRRRRRLYASLAQYAQEEQAASPYTILIDVDALGSVDAALLRAEQVRCTHDTRGLALFVRSERPAEAAWVVDSLADSGFAPVFMVV